MREGWRTCALGNVCEVIAGQSPPGATVNVDGVGLPFAQGSADFGPTSPITTTWSTGSRKEAAVGDVLMSVRAPVGDINRACERMGIGRGLCAIRAGSGVLNDYLALALEYSRAELRRQSSGGMFASITTSAVKGLNIPLPPLAEQRRIVDLVGAVDDQIEASSTALARANAARVATIDELISFQPNGSCPKRPVRKIGSVSREVTVGFVGPQSHLFVDHGVPLLRGVNIRESGLNWSDVKRIPSDVHHRWKKSALTAGDVVLVRVGYPGTACVIPDGLGECNAASLVIVRPDTKMVDPHYVATFFNSPKGKRAVMRRLVGGAQQVLNTKTVADLEMPVPHLAEQHRIVAIVGEFDHYIDRLQVASERIRAARSALLSDLLSGNHQIPAPYDRLLDAV